jgi:hypothetical protein
MISRRPLLLAALLLVSSPGLGDDCPRRADTPLLDVSDLMVPGEWVANAARAAGLLTPPNRLPPGMRFTIEDGPPLSRDELRSLPSSIRLVRLAVGNSSGYYAVTVAGPGSPGAPPLIQANGSQVAGNAFVGGLEIARQVNLSGIVVMEGNRMIVRHRQDFPGATLRIYGRHELRLGGGSAFRMAANVEPRPRVESALPSIQAPIVSMEFLSPGIEYRFRPRSPGEPLVRAWTYAGPEIVFPGSGPATAAGTVSVGAAVDY